MVGRSCCIRNCPSRSHHHTGRKLHHGIRFFAFPKCKKHEGEQVEEVTRRRRMAWVAAVRRKDITFNHISSSMKVCSLHFHSGQPAYEMLETHPDWKPSLHLGHNEVKVTDTQRFTRRLRRRLRPDKTGDRAGQEIKEKAQVEQEEVIKQEVEEVAEQEMEKVIKQEVEEVIIWEEEKMIKQEAEEMIIQEVREMAPWELEEVIKQEVEEVIIWEEEEMIKQEAEEMVIQEVENMAQQEVENMAQQEVENRAQQEVENRTHGDEQSVQECVLCKPRCDEINRLLEENWNLKHELEERRMTEQFLKDDDDKVKYYTGLPSYATFQVLLCHVMPFLPQERRKLTPFQMLLLTFMRLRLDLPLQHISHLFGVHRATVNAAFQVTLGVLYLRLSPLVHWPDRGSVLASLPHQFVETFGKRFAAIVDCFDVFIEKPSNLQARVQTFSNEQRSHTLKYLISFTPQGVISFISKGWGGCTSVKHVTEKSGFLDKLLEGDMVVADRGFDIKQSVGTIRAEVKDVEETKHLRIHLERMFTLVRHKYRILSGKIPIGWIVPCKGEDMTFLDKVVSVCCALTNLCPSVVQ